VPKKLRPIWCSYSYSYSYSESAEILRDSEYEYEYEYEHQMGRTDSGPCPAGRQALTAHWSAHAHNPRRGALSPPAPALHHAPAEEPS